MSKEVPPSRAQHAHREDARAPVHAATRRRRCRWRHRGAGHVRAVPAGAAVGLVASLVAGVGVAPVAVARVGRVRDEVVAREHPPARARQVRVADDAGVDDGHHHVRAARGLVPGGGQVHRRVVPLHAVEPVVRHRRALHPAVGLGPAHARLTRELRRHARGPGLRARGPRRTAPAPPPASPAPAACRWDRAPAAPRASRRARAARPARSPPPRARSAR